MNDLIQRCAACGSDRVVAGKLAFAEGLFFEPAELKKQRYWTTIEFSPRSISVLGDGSASICLDCGNLITALMKVDVKKAWRVLDKYGADALKARLGTPPPVP